MENHQRTEVGRNGRKKETMERQNNQKEKEKMTVVSPYISIITPTANALNSPKGIEWLDGLKTTTKDPTICCPTGDSSPL